MPLLPGAEPFFADGGPVGVVLVHGITGSPASIRPWAEHLAAAGITVAVPRLAGHGTCWQDLAMTRWEDWYAAVERSFDDLTRRCRTVFAGGLSMGGTLVIRLAEERGDAVAGLVLVNPSLLTRDRRMHALPVLRRVVRSVPGIGNDINKRGQDEVAYDRVPLQALHSLTQLWRVTRRDLGRVTQPLLVFRSVVDRVVEPDSAELLRRSVSSSDVEERLLHDSYHVATLDNDAPLIFNGTLDFLRRLAPAPAGELL